jgi:hypothetical protein
MANPKINYMKSVFGLVVFLICFLLQPYAQNTKPKPSSGGDLKVELIGAYKDPKNPSLIEFSLRVWGGSLKAGDWVDMINEDGARKTIQVKSLRDPYQAIAKADNKTGLAYVTFSVGKDDEFTTNDVMVAKGKTITPNATSKDNQFKCLLEGAKWSGSGFASGHAFLKKANVLMSNPKPYLMLPFRTNSSKDDRQLTVFIYADNIKTGDVFTKDKVEVLFSGSPIGDSKNPEMFGCKSPALETDFKIEITSYTEKSKNEAIISGKMSGLMKPVLLNKKPPMQLSNGVFENAPIQIYTEKVKY